MNDEAVRGRTRQGAMKDFFTNGLVSLLVMGFLVVVAMMLMGKVS